MIYSVPHIKNHRLRLTCKISVCLLLGVTSLSMPGTWRCQAQDLESSNIKPVDQTGSVSNNIEYSVPVEDQVKQFNAENEQFKWETAYGASIKDGLESVAKYPTKQQYDANKDALAASWETKFRQRLTPPPGKTFQQLRNDMFEKIKREKGIDLRETGYARIGSFNPYTGEYFYKYYDADGKAIHAVFKKDAQGYKTFQEWNLAAWRRRNKWRETLTAAVKSEAEKRNAVKAVQPTPSPTPTVNEPSNSDYFFKDGNIYAR